MSEQKRILPLRGFRGLDENRDWNADSRTTSSLTNVIVRNGTVTGRPGIDEFDSITTAASPATIIGFADHYNTATATSTLLRMTSTKVEKWTGVGGSWSDITGTALNGTSTTRPDFCMVGELDYLSMCNEGLDRPRKWTGSGNTSVWGGTPPYAKCNEFYVGFLALGNVSDDGSTFDPLTVVLSDDPDNTWVECDDTEIFVTTLVLDESPGEIRRLKVLGPTLLAYKADAIVAVTFVGGATRFHRRKLDFPMGILAPRSLQDLGSAGHIFLASDRNLYLVKGTEVSPLPKNLQTSLQETITIGNAPYVQSALDIDHETYHLFSGTTRLSYNYRTGEFYRGTFAPTFTAAYGFRVAFNTAIRTIAASASLVYELTTGADDNGTSVTRYFDMDWTDFGQQGNKWLLGAELSFTRVRDCRVRISAAADRSSRFLYPKWFSLQGSNTSEDTVRVSYQIPSPIFGTWFKLRVEMFQDAATNLVELLEISPEIIVLNASSEDISSTAEKSQSFKG